MKVTLEIIKDNFIDLIDEGYNITFYQRKPSDKSSLIVNDNRFENLSKIIDYMGKISDEPFLVKSLYNIFIANLTSNRLYKYNDFKNFSSLLINSINRLAHDIELDTEEFILDMDNHQTTITFAIPEIEIKNSAKIYNLRKRFNYKYHGVINIMVNQSNNLNNTPSLSLNIPNKFREDIESFKKTIDDVKIFLYAHNVELKIEGKSILLIPQFEWYKRIEN